MIMRIMRTMSAVSIGAAESTPCAPGIIPNPNEGIRLIASVRPSHTLRADRYEGSACPFRVPRGGFVLTRQPAAKNALTCLPG